MWNKFFLFSFILFIFLLLLLGLIFFFVNYEYLSKEENIQVFFQDESNISKYNFYKVGKNRDVNYILRLKIPSDDTFDYLQINQVTKRVHYHTAPWCRKEILKLLFWKKNCYGGTVLGETIKGYEKDIYNFNKGVLDITYYFLRRNDKKLKIRIIGL